MGINKIHKGTVTKGKFIPRDRTALLLDFAKREGKSIEVVVRDERKNRSRLENAYYWAVPIPLISEATGFDRDETHLAMRIEFLTDNSGMLSKVRSTADLTTVEFEEYLSKIRRWASEFLSIYIPEPNEVDY